MMGEIEKRNKGSKLPLLNLALIIMLGLFVLANESEQDIRLNTLFEIITSKYTVDF